jgi:hypothetical protein
MRLGKVERAGLSRGFCIAKARRALNPYNEEKRCPTMNAEQPPDPQPNPQQPVPAGYPGGFTQEVKHSPVSARIPEKVGRGVFSTGILVLQGPNEFVIDFVLSLAHPSQIVARVVLPPAIMPSMLAALRENLGLYQAKHGPLPPLAVPTPPTPPSIEEIYRQLKLPDESLSGVYANTVMIAHSPAEFYFDFITNFYPRSAVSCRVFFSAPQIPGILNTLTRSYQQYQQKLAADQSPKPNEPGPSAP